MGTRGGLRTLRRHARNIYEHPTCGADGKLITAGRGKVGGRHPGEILREEFMKPRGLSQNALGRALNVPPRRINELVHARRAVTADSTGCTVSKNVPSGDAPRLARNRTAAGPDGRNAS